LKGHWSLSDALDYAISISVKFRGEIETSTSYDNLMDENTNFVLELICLVSNIKNVGVLDSCLSFMRKYEKKKVHNIV
jgi:hypothetical protein